MAASTFNPPLRLAGRPEVLVSTIDEAVAFVRNYQGARRPMTQNGVLRWLQTASGLQAKREAGDAFRAWAESEGLLIETK